MNIDKRTFLFANRLKDRCEKVLDREEAVYIFNILGVRYNKLMLSERKSTHNINIANEIIEKYIEDVKTVIYNTDISNVKLMLMAIDYIVKLRTKLKSMDIKLVTDIHTIFWDIGVEDILETPIQLVGRLFPKAKKHELAVYSDKLYDLNVNNLEILHVDLKNILYYDSGKTDYKHPYALRSVVTFDNVLKVLELTDADISYTKDICEQELKNLSNGALPRESDFLTVCIPSLDNLLNMFDVIDNMFKKLKADDRA